MAEEKKYQITIVDDDDFLVNMYATKFGNNGIAVEACKSADSFLEKLRGGAKTDLVLLDIVMPGMTGLELLKQVRTEKLAEGIPIIMLTNQGDEKDISEAKRLGVSGYIVKSAATPSEVVDEVKRVLNIK